VILLNLVYSDGFLPFFPSQQGFFCIYVCTIIHVTAESGQLASRARLRGAALVSFFFRFQAIRAWLWLGRLSRCIVVYLCVWCAVVWCVTISQFNYNRTVLCTVGKTPVLCRVMLSWCRGRVLLSRALAVEF
jgi:hypothetical protein